MGILDRIESRATIEDPTVPLSSASALLTDAWGGPPTQAGVRVTEQRALTFGAVWACVDLISGVLSSVPIDFLERLTPRGRRKLVEDSRYRVMRWKANPELESNVFLKVLQAHKLTWGNAYAEKEFNKRAELIALWPLLPDRTRCERIAGEKWYITRVKEKTGERELALPAWKVLHVPGLGFDGLKGYSVIGLAMKMAVAVGMAADEYAARFYGSGMMTSGVLSHPQTLSKEAQDRLRLEFEQRNQGLTMAHRLMILEEGLKYERTGIPPEEAQFLGSRLFQRREIAGMYHVPPDMIGDLEHGGAYNSTEARQIAFKQQCLRSHAVDWERALTGQLCDEEELLRVYFAFNFRELERADLKSRMESYQIGRNIGVWSADDIREFEDENPLPDGQGEVYLVPLNMIPADQLTKQEEPAEPADDEGDDEGDDTAPPAPQRAARLELLLGRLRRAYQGLFAEAFGRIVRREVKTLRGLLGRTESLHAFATATESCYAATLARDAERDLVPPLDALARYLREELTGLYGQTRLEASAAAAAVAAQLVARHVEISQDALRTAIGIPGGVEHLLASWEANRASELADIETPAICTDLANRFRQET